MRFPTANHHGDALVATGDVEHLITSRQFLQPRVELGIGDVVQGHLLRIGDIAQHIFRCHRLYACVREPVAHAVHKSFCLSHRGHTSILFLEPYLQVGLVGLEDQVVDIPRDVHLHLGIGIVFLQISHERRLHRVEGFLAVCLQVDHSFVVRDILGMGENKLLRAHHRRCRLQPAFGCVQQFLRPSVVLFCRDAFVPIDGHQGILVRDIGHAFLLHEGKDHRDRQQAKEKECHAPFPVPQGPPHGRLIDAHEHLLRLFLLGQVEAFLLEQGIIVDRHHHGCHG